MLCGYTKNGPVLRADNLFHVFYYKIMSMNGADFVKIPKSGLGLPSADSETGRMCWWIWICDERKSRIRWFQVGFSFKIVYVSQNNGPIT